ncbi:MAG: hypothetical protein ACYS99_02155 [Planctomycetota bacterium]|jgi:hypothetical protein
MRTAAIALALLLLAVACGGDDYEPRTPITGARAVKPPPPRDLSDQEGQDMLTFRCTKCHTTTPIKKSRKMLAEWEDQLRICIDQGARVAPVERGSLAQFLFKNYGK